MGNEEVAAYFETFDSLFLSILDGVAEGDATKKRKCACSETQCISAERFSALVAQEALELVMGIRTPRL